MVLYEHIFMARQDVSSQQVDALVEHFKEVLESNGGSVGKIENWGLKVLPYRVKKNRKAHYALMNVTAPPQAVFEMERQMRLHEDIVRYMTVRVDEHEEEPSAMLRKSEREDRSRDGDTDDRNGADEGGGSAKDASGKDASDSEKTDESALDDSAPKEAEAKASDEPSSADGATDGAAGDSSADSPDDSPKDDSLNADSSNDDSAKEADSAQEADPAQEDDSAQEKTGDK